MCENTNFKDKKHNVCVVQSKKERHWPDRSGRFIQIPKKPSSHALKKEKGKEDINNWMRKNCWKLTLRTRLITDGPIYPTN